VSRIAYVNGLYTPLAQARVHIEDRGYQFADGVYEVVEVFQGALIDEQRHLDRLARSLRELRIGAPLGDAALRIVLREIVARNKLRDGFVYLQVTRGVARRDHFFPDPPPKPSLVVTARLNDPAKIEAKAAQGIGVTSMPDLRWKRPDIKTINLIANVLAKQAAKEQGSGEAWATRVKARWMVLSGAMRNSAPQRWSLRAESSMSSATPLQSSASMACM